MNNIDYSAKGNIAVRFYNHVCLGLKPTIQEHDRNLIEKIGDVGVWPLENLPAKALNAAKDPRVLTIALTALAMLADSFGFYPNETTIWIKTAWALLPTIPFWAIKLIGYISTIEIIGSYGLRAEGRFINKPLMDGFYKIETSE